jgi:rod shape-determining protein MreC
VYDKTVRRRRAVLGLLVVSSLILLTASFGDSAGGGLSSVQRGVQEALSPIQEGASRVLKPVRDLFGWAGDTLNAKGEVKDLRGERDQLRAQLVAQTAAVRKAGQLATMDRLLREAELAHAGPVTARVIGQDPSLWYSQIQVNKGSTDGVHVDDPVIGPAGLIGRVSFVSSGTATVTLITDHTTNVSARVSESGVTGVVEVEAGRPTDLVLGFTSRKDRVDPGQVVVTAGTQSRVSRLESLYPPDIPIGQVTRVDDPQTDDQQVHLKPFSDVRRLEFVQVLTRTGGERSP